MKERKKWDDLQRVLVPIVLGVLLIRWSPAFAQVFGVPEVSVVGLYVGWLTIGVGVSHYMRRALFPGWDLRQIMAIAVRDRQAGHVVLGICIVLAALILVAGRAQAGELTANAQVEEDMAQVEHDRYNARYVEIYRLQRDIAEHRAAVHRVHKTAVATAHEQPSDRGSPREARQVHGGDS